MKGAEHVMVDSIIVMQDAVISSVRRCSDPELLDLMHKLLILEE